MSHFIERVRYPKLPEDLTNELFLGLFWEETFFNNIRQVGKGTGVGFGQVEPSTFINLHGGNPADDDKVGPDDRRLRQSRRDMALSYGYHIEWHKLPIVSETIVVSIPGTTSTRRERKTHLAPNAHLSIELSIKLSMCSMHYLYVAKGGRRGALQAYGGVGYGGSGNPFSDSERVGKLAKIQACETDLLKLPRHLKGKDRETAIMEALNKAKNFKLQFENWREILFNPADRVLQEMREKAGY
jgi:hypothetical protein